MTTGNLVPTIESVYTITDKEALGVEYDYSTRQFDCRDTVRAVVVNNDRLIAVQNVTMFGGYSLPGGGIEDDETIEQALMREMCEELGAEVSIIESLGLIKTLRYKPDADKGKMYIANCFICSVVGNLKPLTLTDQEIEFGTELLWLSLDEVMHKIKNLPPDIDDFAKLNSLRDLYLLDQASLRYKNLVK